MFFMPWTRSDTALSQEDIISVVNHTPKMDGLEKIIVFNHLKILIICLNTPFVVFDRSSRSKWWRGKKENTRMMMLELGNMLLL